MTNLIIDFPDYLIDKNTPYLIQEKFFEYINKREKYAKDFTILYLSHKESSKHIEKLINDWDLKSISFYGGTLKEKVQQIKDMSDMSDESLIFFSYNQQQRDMGNKILLDQCYNKNTYMNICRMDFGNELY